MTKKQTVTDDLSAHRDAPTGFFNWFKGFGQSGRNAAPPTLEDFIDISEDGSEDADVITDHEKMLLANILKLRDVSVVDVMVPRADIIAVEVNSAPEDLFALLSEHQVSRIAVYEENLDNVLGCIHIKDVLSVILTKNPFVIREHLFDVPIVSPAMPILDLIIEMRQNSRHLAMVVDEHGGIDGLVTLNDIIEEIVGNIDDEHDHDDPMMAVHDDGSVFADGRLDIEEFEAEFGPLLDDEEREEIETIGGLVYTIAGRIPKRGEVLKHPASGMVFEVLDADPRRVQRLRIRDIPR